MQSNVLVTTSDVKRGQNLEAEAITLSPRPRPELWSRGRRQSYEAEANFWRLRLRPKFWPRGL